MTARAARPQAARRWMACGGASPSSDGSYLISTRAPTTTQLCIARLLGVLMLVAYGVAVGWRTTMLPRQDAFVPIANTIIIINDVITAALLSTQFAVTRQRALLVLASGYLFKALLLVPHALTFPGAFAPAGLLGAGTQTTAWLYQTQHVGFLLAAVGYTVLRDRPDPAPVREGRAAPEVVACFLAVALGALFVTLLTTAGGSLLPTIMADSMRTAHGFQRIGQPMMIVIGCGAILVFRRRPTSVIDLWLSVAVLSWLFESLLQAIVPGRFSLVFYVSRSMGVVSSSFILIALLSESLKLHRRLVLATVARDQEREGHRTAIDIIVGSLAHELRQPLTSILSNESAGTKLLAAQPPDRAEVAAALADIRGSVLRANEIIDSVRGMFATSPPDRAPIDVNELAMQAVELMRVELETHRVALDLQLAPGLPPVHGHRGQLLEVLLNGLKNALDSLSGVMDRPRQLHVRTSAIEGEALCIAIEDAGGGIEPGMHDRHFEPFHSTKASGMGLGLSICLSIVVAHGGRLSLKPRVPHGAVFRVDLPTLAPDAAESRVASAAVSSRLAWR